MSENQPGSPWASAFAQSVFWICMAVVFIVCAALCFN